MHEQQATGSMVEGYRALTEKEKQTLRLLLDGYDAKSMARDLGLSVHTINERLRDARRKLSVSSSREAARMLREAERADPENPGNTSFGDAGLRPLDQHLGQPATRPRTRRAVWGFGGFVMISLLVAAMLALSTPAHRPPDVQQSSPGATAPSATMELSATSAARDWLALVDKGEWARSWAGTARSFQSLNSVKAWQAASEKARSPLGPVLSRRLIGDQDVPAPPHGYRVVRFESDFANKSGVTETVSLDREDDRWKVVGIYIE